MMAESGFVDIVSRSSISQYISLFHYCAKPDQVEALDHVVLREPEQDAFVHSGIHRKLWEFAVLDRVSYERSHLDPTTLWNLIVYAKSGRCHQSSPHVAVDDHLARFREPPNHSGFTHRSAPGESQLKDAIRAASSNFLTSSSVIGRSPTMTGGTSTTG